MIRVPTSSIFAKKYILFLALSTLIITSSCFAESSDFHNSISLQGYTGLLNTPSAEITEEGVFYGLYSNQIDQKWRGKIPRQDSYLVSLGLFSFMEFGGRLTEAPGQARDMSASIKIKLPFIPKEPYMPSVAVGIQDIGGGSTHLRTSYLVATEELWRLRLSLGYGKGPDRMKGLFGGGELRAFPWLYLIGEHDGSDTNIGAKIITPEVFGIPVNLQLTAKTSLDFKPGNFDLAFGLQFPLGIPHLNGQPLPSHHESAEAAYRKAPPEQPPVTGQLAADQVEAAETAPATIGSLVTLVEKLGSAGFQNVRVGQSNGKLVVVEFENSRYNQNELDAIGVVAGIAAFSTHSQAETLRLVVLKKALRIYQVEVSLPLLRTFLKDSREEQKLRDSVVFSEEISDDTAVSYLTETTDPSTLRSSLLLFPGLRTFVGTEVGVFDYLLSLKPELSVNAWPGAQVLARWDIPVAWSKNFEDGETFAGYRKETRTERVMLFQALKVAPTVMVNIGGGLILPDTFGTINELRWSPSAAHRFTLRQAYADDTLQKVTKQVYLGSYRYYYSPQELYLEGTAGKFWDQDTGFTLQMKRFFGDTAVSIYFKYGTTQDDKERVKIGGIQFAFPLTPRRDMKQNPVQLRGPDDWSYSQETVIARHGESNSLGRSIGVVPMASYNLDHTFYNRDRLNAEYIREHLLRLRDAYTTYGVNP